MKDITITKIVWCTRTHRYRSLEDCLGCKYNHYGDFNGDFVQCKYKPPQKVDVQTLHDRIKELEEILEEWVDDNE